MLVEEIIQRVQSEYSKGVQSDDSRLRPRHIFSEVLGARAMLIEQQANKKQFNSQFTYVTIPCLHLEKVAAHNCPYSPSLGCKTFRSAKKIPAPLVGLNGHLVQSVTSLDGSTIYSELDWKGRTYKKGNKYTQTKPEYYFRDDYLWLTTAQNSPQVVTLIYMPEDPIAALKVAEDDPCKAYSQYDLLMRQSTAKTVVDMTVERLLRSYNASVEDVSNNSQDSAPPQPTK